MIVVQIPTPLDIYLFVCFRQERFGNPVLLTRACSFTGECSGYNHTQLTFITIMNGNEQSTYVQHKQDIPKVMVIMYF